MEKKTTICEWINTSTKQNWHVYCTQELLAINSKRTISPETPTLCIRSLFCLPWQLKIEMHLTVMLLKNLLNFLFSSYSFNFASFFLLHRSDMIQSSYSSVYLIICFILSFVGSSATVDLLSHCTCTSLHLLRRFMGGRRNQCTLSSSDCLYYFYH